MDLSDMQTMLEDGIAFAKKVRCEVQRRKLEGVREVKGVLEYKIAAIRRVMAGFRPKKDEVPRFSMLKSSFLAFEKDCQPLFLSLDHYSPQDLSVPVEDPPSPSRQVSMDLLPVQPYLLEEEKAQRVDRIAADLAALREIASDTAELIGTQGTLLTKVEEHVDDTKADTSKAGEELKSAAIEQNKKWKWYFGSGMGTVGGILGLIIGPLGVPIGAAIGGMAGAAVGKAIEKHENSAVNSIQFNKE